MGAKSSRRRLLETASGRALAAVGGQGYSCPAGYYCPAGSGLEEACPVGRWQPKTGQSSRTSCLACRAGTYGGEVGQAKCSPCQGSSNSAPGSATCRCIGLNRVYLTAVGTCVCKSGYVPSDGSSADKDSDVDCQKRVYERCPGGRSLDANGVCRGKADCAAQCDGVGTLEAGLGVCRCDGTATAKEICDSTCIKTLRRATFTATGDFQVTDSSNRVTKVRRSRLSSLAGRARCQLKDSSKC